MKNLLVVDWDYFFHNKIECGHLPPHRDLGLYDWGHNESPFMIHEIWNIRASVFRATGQDLPRCEGYSDFWDQFTFSDPEPTLYVAESNVHALYMEPLLTAGGDSISRVTLYDAHHDSGYRGTLDSLIESDEYSAENWTIPLYSRGAEIHVRYPPWKIAKSEGEPTPLIPIHVDDDDNGQDDLTYDGVFLCRSGAWVPSWCDDQFTEFIDLFPGRYTPLIAPMTPRAINAKTIQILEQIERKSHP